MARTKVGFVTVAEVLDELQLQQMELYQEIKMSDPWLRPALWSMVRDNVRMASTVSRIAADVLKREAEEQSILMGSAEAALGRLAENSGNHDGDGGTGHVTQF